MIEKLHQEFITGLEEHFGIWEKSSSKFGSTSYGEVASELYISASQFSKLIAQSATEGMYQRSIKHIAQLKHYSSLELETQKLKAEREDLTNRLVKRKSRRVRILTVLGLGLAGLMGYLFSDVFKKPEQIILEDGKHSLTEFFDRQYNSEFVSPYMSGQAAQEYCPCSGYEGVWALDKDYVIPIPDKKPGVYYVAKSIDMRMKCLRSTEVEKRGKQMIGFENLRHEIWVDKKQEPLSPSYFDTENKSFTKEFYNLNFEENDQFVKVAEVSSFLFNQFEIYPDSITRKGEPCGRYAQLIDQDLADEYEIDLKHLLEDVIGNLIVVNCQPAANNYCNPNQLKENESTISFDCHFTIKTENLGIGGGYPYSKAYKLIEQNYSNNLLCRCE